MRIWRIGDAKRLIEKAKYNPFVKSIAVQIIKRRKVPHKDYLGQTRAIFDFVRSRVKYIKDPVGYDQLSPPIRTIYQGYGDCEDNAVLLASLLESIGIPTKLKLVATRGPKYDHIYVLAGIPLDSKVRWMPLDTTLARTKPMGYEVSYKKARVF